MIQVNRTSSSLDRSDLYLKSIQICVKRSQTSSFIFGFPE
ncbi:hypothetical protein PM8797T_24176 [Gimesia maris DSM 8797]|nr:hypothetical protein PM8797T_24176 [Gimesia maris DSM 8797]